MCFKVVTAQDDSLGIALINANLISGLRDSVEHNKVILIANERIEDVFSTGIKPVPQGYTKVDLKGKYIIPGLIDAHYHILANRRRTEIDSLLQYAIAGGITSVREMVSDAILMGELSQKAKSSAVLSPRIYYSAIFAGQNFVSNDQRVASISHGMRAGTAPWAKMITDTTNIEKAVRAAKAYGVSAIKIYAELNANKIKEVTEAAHRNGLKVWTHATVFPALSYDAVNAKVDAISHALDLSWQLEDSVPQTVYPLPVNYSRPRDWGKYSISSQRLAGLIQLMKKNGTALDATVSHTHTRIVMRQLALPENERRYKDPTLLDKWTFGVTNYAYLNGINILAGTDYQENPALFEYPGVHYEMELLVKDCGLKPIDALRAAGMNVARVMGAEKDLGTIEKGKIADMVVLNKNPLEEINNTKSIVAVVKGGKWYEGINLYSKKPLLDEVERTVWTPYKKAFNELNTEAFMNLHSKKTAIVNRDRRIIQNFEEYKDEVRMANHWSQKNVGLQSLEIRFTQQLASATQVYQEGIYQIRTILNDGRKQFIYGRFSVYLVKENTEWKILFDTDTREGITEKDFLQASD